jgi:maltokinase
VVAELRLDATHAIRVTTTEGGHRAEPATLVGDAWRRSTAGDGAGLALLHRLRNRMAVEEGFRVAAASWVDLEDETEREMGVDQTHDSWVVGGRVVVKWMTDRLVGPHPAPDRLRRLAEAGFEESPALVGLVEWSEPETGHWVPVAVAQAYLPGTADGWTWALDEARRGLGVRPGQATPFAHDLGGVVARMHLALADDPAARLTADGARRQADEALAALDLAVRLVEEHDPASFAALSGHRREIEEVLERLAGAAGTPVLPIHGDLHVGQILRDAAGRYDVVDFDGNPTRTPALRVEDAPAACDVAGMLVSLENVEHVVRHYTPELDHAAGAAWTADAKEQFLTGYRSALGTRGDLLDDALLPSYRWEQVCREIVYAVRHDLLEWLYVPAAALRRRIASEQ